MAMGRGDPVRASSVAQCVSRATVNLTGRSTETELCRTRKTRLGRRYAASVEPALALLAGMQLGVFTALGEGQLSAKEVATEINCDAGRLSRLLYALAHVGLLEVTDGRFGNGAEAAEVLVAGKPGFVGGAHR